MLGELVVDAEKKLPAICLRCATKKGIVRRHEKLVAATASQGVGAVGGVTGVMVARAMREDPVAAALVLGGSLVGAVIVGYALHAHAPKVELALPLCRDCNEAWNVGRRARTAILATIALSFAALVWGFFAHESLGYVIGGALLAAGFAGALAFRLRDRFVYASAIQGTRVVLKNVNAKIRAAQSPSREA